MSDVTVRPARAADADAVFELLTLFAHQYAPIQRADFDRSWPRARDQVLVAEDDSRVLGYTLACPMTVLFAPAPVIVLQELTVHPEHRRRGIGARLVAEVVAGARKSGAAEVTVPTRRARDYYPRLGFTEIGGYFRMGLRD